MMCGRLLPTLFFIGSIKTGTTSLWGHLVDLSKGSVEPGAHTDKGDVSRKEKDFFGDPAMFRRGRRFYERIWPKCPAAGRRVVGIDATPAYHVWCDLVRVRVRVRDRVRITLTLTLTLTFTYPYP